MAIEGSRLDYRRMAESTSSNNACLPQEIAISAGWRRPALSGCEVDYVDQITGRDLHVKNQPRRVVRRDRMGQLGYGFDDASAWFVGSIGSRPDQQALP